ncbi:hypothetical protein PR003_g16172 [Phytophthora rubi]|uniref:Uncharacterized protein n=1 Tax=Phytophthora rubi TaxID=129364 RepID=A0A6A4EIN6_9STRA|nr:hypothetical protein PR002_g17259 [Phytophthora rubi]KAE9050716.1 hypothetical protein PR001_g2121 [Phytophthora rubi]KAE9326777.1 hypothetical protein PR003_g16172 [Phytophthora rubi]
MFWSDTNCWISVSPVSSLLFSVTGLQCLAAAPIDALVADLVFLETPVKALELYSFHRLLR